MPRAVFARAQPPAKLDAGKAGQHPIEDDQVRRILADRHLRLVAAPREHDAKPFRFEVILQKEGQRLFIFNDQNFGIHRSVLSWMAPTSSDLIRGSRAAMTFSAIEF